jgi:hypothetical protein
MVDLLVECVNEPFAGSYALNPNDTIAVWSLRSRCNLIQNKPLRVIGAPSRHAGLTELPMATIRPFDRLNLVRALGLVAAHHSLTQDATGEMLGPWRHRARRAWLVVFTVFLGASRLS